MRWLKSTNSNERLEAEISSLRQKLNDAENVIYNLRQELQIAQSKLEKAPAHPECRNGLGSNPEQKADPKEALDGKSRDDLKKNKKNQKYPSSAARKMLRSNFGDKPTSISKKYYSLTQKLGRTPTIVELGLTVAALSREIGRSASPNKLQPWNHRSQLAARRQLLKEPQIVEYLYEFELPRTVEIERTRAEERLRQREADRARRAEALLERVKAEKMAKEREAEKMAKEREAEKMAKEREAEKIAKQREAEDQIWSALEERLDKAFAEKGAPLLRNYRSAIKRDDYGNIIFDRRLDEVELFLKSINVEFQKLATINRERCAEKISKWCHEKEKDNLSSNTIPEDGVDFEHWVASHLSKVGWHTTVTQASGDDGVDVIATKDWISVAIQCKRYAGSVGNKAVQEVYTGMKHMQLDRAAVISTGSYTKSAKQLANTTGVLLLTVDDISFLDDLLRFPK